MCSAPQENNCATKVCFFSSRTEAWNTLQISGTFACARAKRGRSLLGVQTVIRNNAARKEML